MKEGIRLSDESSFLNNSTFAFNSLGIKDVDAHQKVYSKIIDQIFMSGYKKSDAEEVFLILNNPTNLCRNENLEKVLKLINGESNIKIKSFGNELNLNSCKVMGGQGFRTAMIEGFSGSALGNKIQVVITFDPKHIISKREARVSDEISTTKPETAKVSLQIEGEIKEEDVQMISIRIPKVLINEDFMTEEELENEENNFITRHYTK